MTVAALRAVQCSARLCIQGAHGAGKGACKMQNSRRTCADILVGKDAAPATNTGQRPQLAKWKLVRKTEELCVGFDGDHCHGTQ